MSKRHKNRETSKQTFSTTEKVTTLEKGVDYQTVSTSTTTVTTEQSTTVPAVTEEEKEKEEKKENNIDILFDLF